MQRLVKVIWRVDVANSLKTVSVTACALVRAFNSPDVAVADACKYEMQMKH